MKRLDLLKEYWIWPIKIQFIDKAGYTLWGDGNQQQDKDFLLALDNKIVVFDTLEYLHRFILKDNLSNFSILPGYQILQKQLMINNDLILNYQPIVQFNFKNILNKLYKRPVNLDKLEKHQVLTGMNMLWDAAHTLDDQWIVEQCKQEVWPVGSFLDTLTWGSDEKLRKFNKKDVIQIRKFYLEALQRINANSLVLTTYESYKQKWEEDNNQ